MTCQYNKINVIDSNIVKEAFKKYKVIKVKADWTKPNKKIENFLFENKKFGIPFNIIYNKNNVDGISFSEILSSKEILKTLESF